MTEPLEPTGLPLRDGESPRREEPAGSGVVLDAQQLFAGRREVVIEHEGVRYRLRITRRNKLILQK